MTLDHLMITARCPAALSACFFVTLRRASYEFLMDRSGLPDPHFFMLVLGIGTASSSNSPHWGMRPTLRVPVPEPWLSSPQQRFVCLPASSFFSSLFNGCETRSARRQLVPKLTAEWLRPERRGTRTSLVTAGLRKDAIVLRLRHTGCPSVRTARGFASLGTTSASGWRTRGSRDRSNWARAARG